MLFGVKRRTKVYLKSTVHLIELDTDNKSYQEIKDEMIQDIAQLVLMIIDYQDGLVQLNRGAEILFNLINGVIKKNVDVSAFFLFYVL